MKMKEYVETIYNLQGKATEWCIIEETTHPKDTSNMDSDMKLLIELGLWPIEKETNQKTKTTYKPGLFVKGTKLYVDLFARRFYTIVEFPEFSRKVLPAYWTYVRGGMVCIRAKNDESIFLMLSRNFILDIHNTCRYEKWMEERLLL